MLWAALPRRLQGAPPRSCWAPGTRPCLAHASQRRAAITLTSSLAETARRKPSRNWGVRPFCPRLTCMFQVQPRLLRVSSRAGAERQHRRQGREGSLDSGRHATLDGSPHRADGAAQALRLCPLRLALLVGQSLLVARRDWHQQQPLSRRRAARCCCPERKARPSSLQLAEAGPRRMHCAAHLQGWFEPWAQWAAAEKAQREKGLGSRAICWGKPMFVLLRANQSGLALFLKANCGRIDC